MNRQDPDMFVTCVLMYVRIAHPASVGCQSCAPERERDRAVSRPRTVRVTAELVLAPFAEEY